MTAIDKKEETRNRYIQRLNEITNQQYQELTGADFCRMIEQCLFDMAKNQYTYFDNIQFYTVVLPSYENDAWQNARVWVRFNYHAGYYIQDFKPPCKNYPNALLYAIFILEDFEIISKPLAAEMIVSLIRLCKMESLLPDFEKIDWMTI